jgi:hypothetical protein
MTTIPIDTHKTIQKLVSRGFTPEQAEGVIEVLTESELLTKDYFEARLYRALLIHGLTVVGGILGGAVVLLQLQ